MSSQSTSKKRGSALSYSIGCPRARLETYFLEGALSFLQGFLCRSLVEAWAVAGGHRWRTCLFSPLPTLLACLHKQLAPGTSCRDVEDWAASLLPPSETINAGDDFCEARKRLPETVFLHALAHTAKLCSPASVWLVDGTALTLPRSAANLQAFGLPHTKARMPNARLLLFSGAASGAIMQADITGCHEGEMRQFLRCLPNVPAGTTLVGDRQFCSYLALCDVQRQGCHAVTRLNVLRKPVKVRPQGKGDEIQTWQKPRLKSSAFPEHIARLPQFMEVRVVRCVLKRKGYRSVLLELATTLLDAELWPVEKILDLYESRWRIEDDIRSLKLKHGLKMLTCKSEDTVRKEVWSALIAYNAVKVLQTQSGQCPRDLSHERSRELISEMNSQAVNELTATLPRIYQRLLKGLAKCRQRRQERPPCPRALAHDPKEYPLLRITRQQWYANYHAA